MKKLQIEIWALRRLFVYGNNARMHSDEQIDQIIASILEFGFTNPILVDSKGEIIAGHGRYEAAKRLNLETVPVIVLDHLTEAQKTAYRIADNQIASKSSWDLEKLSRDLESLQEYKFDLSVIAFSKEEIDILLSDEKSIIPVSRNTDEAKSVEVSGHTRHVGKTDSPAGGKMRKSVASSGDVWLLGSHRIKCGEAGDHHDIDKIITAWQKFTGAAAVHEESGDFFDDFNK